MRQLTIHVQDNKLQFVVDLLSNFSFVKIDKPERNYTVTEEQKALINEVYRKVEENPNYALDWEEAKHLIKVD